MDPRKEVEMIFYGEPPKIIFENSSSKRKMVRNILKFFGKKKKNPRTEGDFSRAFLKKLMKGLDQQNMLIE